MTQIPHSVARRARAWGSGRAVFWGVAALVMIGLGLLAVLGIRGIQRGRESTLESARAAAVGAVERAVQMAREGLPGRLAKARALRSYPLVPSPSGGPEIAKRSGKHCGMKS